MTATEEGTPNALSSFGYQYFDDPCGDGYRGYYRNANGDGDYLPWDAARDFCSARDVRTAMDLGCAKGFLVAELMAVGIDVVGLDVSDYALSFTKGLPCYKTDLRSGVPRAADAVFALGVLLYLEEAELAGVLANIHANTERYFLVSGYYAGEEQGVPDPLRRITRSRLWWRGQIEDAGFRFSYEGADFDVYTA